MHLLPRLDNNYRHYACSKKLNNNYYTCAVSSSPIAVTNYPFPPWLLPSSILALSSLPSSPVPETKSCESSPVGAKTDKKTSQDGSAVVDDDTEESCRSSPVTWKTGEKSSPVVPPDPSDETQFVKTTPNPSESGCEFSVNSIGAETSSEGEPPRGEESPSDAEPLFELEPSKDEKVMSSKSPSGGMEIPGENPSSSDVALEEGQPAEIFSDRSKNEDASPQSEDKPEERQPNTVTTDQSEGTDTESPLVSRDTPPELQLESSSPATCVDVVAALPSTPSDKEDQQEITSTGRRPPHDTHSPRREQHEMLSSCQKIRKNIALILRRLHPRMIQDDLLKMGVITRDELEKLRSLKERKESVKFLLQTLLQKTNAIIQEFITCLGKHHRYTDLAEKLNELPGEASGEKTELASLTANVEWDKDSPKPPPSGCHAKVPTC